MYVYFIFYIYIIINITQRKSIFICMYTHTHTHTHTHVHTHTHTHILHTHTHTHMHMHYIHRPCYAVMLEISCTAPTFSIFKLFSNRLRESAAAAHVNFPYKFQKNWFFWKNRWNRLSLSRFSEHGQLRIKKSNFLFFVDELQNLNGNFVVVIWDDLQICIGIGGLIFSQ